MTEIIKPSFEETRAITTMDLKDVGLSFNAQKVGPMNFLNLRKADYGEGFSMATMPELVPLVYASLENQDYASAKGVIKTLKDSRITGNTGILYTKNGIYVQDNPNIRKQNLSITEKTLKSKLGSFEENGVIFSDDKNVRFTPNDFKKGSQTYSELAQNKGIVALVGGQENAEKLAKVSEHWKTQPYFWALSDVDSPQIRIADLDSGGFVGRLYADANNGVGFDYRYSFGVLNSSRSDAPKK